MRFVCESCRAQYMINDEKVGPKGVKVRCRKCGYVILVKRGGEAQAKAPSEPDDSQATQILQSPLAAAPPVAAKSTAGDTVSESTNPDSAQKSARDALLGDAGDDEIGAVFDQVLNSGSNSIPKDGLGSGEERRTEMHAAVPGMGLDNDDDDDDRASTRVIDAAVVRKLAEQSGERPAVRDSAPAKNGHSETDVPQTDWFVAIDEKQTGPLTLEKVKEHWDRGEVGPDSLCWRAGFTDWVPLSDVAQLASVLAPRPASKPIVMNAPMGPSVVSVPVESAFSAGGVMKSVRSEVQVPMGASAAPEETGSWRPSTSLGSLVQDEMAALSRPSATLEDPPEGTDTGSDGLLDVPPPDDKPHANGRVNGHAGASVDHQPHAPNSRNSRPPSPAQAPANPYVATPGATYSSPGITQYRPDKDRSQLMIWVAVGLGGVLVATLLGLVIWLATRQPQPQVVQVPVPAPVVVAAAPVQPQPTPVAAAPAQIAPAGQPAAAAVAPAAAQPTGPLPPNAKPAPTGPLPPKAAGGGLKVGTPTGIGAVKAEKPIEKTTEKPEKAPEKSKGKDDDDDAFAREFGGSETPKETPKPAAAEKKKSGPYIPPAPGAASSDVKESLGQADVFEVVSGYKAALVKCGEEQHKREPGVTGKLLMKWSIQPSGKVSNVSVQSEEFKSTYMATCVGGMIKTWVFPKHKVAGDPIVFPFKF